MPASPDAFIEANPDDYLDFYYRWVEQFEVVGVEDLRVIINHELPHGQIIIHYPNGKTAQVTLNEDMT